MILARYASMSVSFTAVLSSLGLFACSDVSEDVPLELGLATQALGRADHDKAGRPPRCKHGRSCRHPRQCADAEPEPDPVVFTPATAAKRSERRAGVAVAYGPLTTEPLYADLIAQQFSAVTPENETKWGALQPQDPNTWDFDQADGIVAFAQDNDLAIKGHTLVWHSQLPSFIDAETTPRALRRYTGRHIDRTMHHFRSDMFAWDVVNEAVADDGGGLRDTPFSAAFGEEYIDRAFRRAKSADSKAKLYYNDYGIEGANAKSDAVYALMQRLIQRHVPVDGIGFQSHFDARFVPSLQDLVTNFQRFADLGLSINISELDVRVARLGGSQASKLAVQKQIYQRVAAACLQVEACDGITTWGFTDAHSWVDSTFGADDPLLFDDQYQKKPAYFGYVDGFLGVPLDDPALAPNLIGNSSLEAGLDGWSGLGSGQLATEVGLAHTGLRSARVSGRDASWQGPEHDVTSVTGATRSYDASVWVRIAGATSANAGLTAQISCAGQEVLFQPVANGTVTSSDWVQLSGTLSVPSCDLQSVALYVEGPDAGIDILVDDLALREQPLPNLIANPDFEAGTAGWFGFGPTVLGTTADAHGGDQAIVGSGRTDTWNGIATDVTSLVVPTASYHAGAWLKLAGAASDRVGLTIAVGCAGGSTQFLPVGSATGTDSGWVEVSGSVVIPNCSVQSAVLYAEGPAAGVTLLMDDVSFWQTAAGLDPNVIANPGFESGTGSWFGFGSVSILAATDRAHTGAQSGRVTGRTDTWNGLATSLVGQLTPGANYSVSAWVQVGEGSQSVNLTFQNACDGGATNYSFLAGGTVNATTWTQLQGTLAAPDCTLSTANFYAEGAPAGVDIYLDDVEVRKLP